MADVISALVRALVTPTTRKQNNSQEKDWIGEPSRNLDNRVRDASDRHWTEDAPVGALPKKLLKQ